MVAEIEKKTQKKDPTVDLQAQIDNLAAKVRRMSDNWKRFAKVHLGCEADDGKVGKVSVAVLVAVLMTAVGVSVLFGAQAKESGDKAHWDVAAVRSNGDIDTDGAVVAAGASTLSSTLEVTGATTLSSTLGVTGAATFSSTVTTPLVSVSATNSHALTVAARVYNVTGIGGANNSTNTITLANATDGMVVTLVVNASSTNLITIADSGIMKLSGAWLGDNDDNITLLGVSTNWVEIGQVDN